MARWWEKYRDKALLPLPNVRPVFHRKKSVLRSVRLDERLVEAVKEKAETERTDFNSVVQLLLWTWIGAPPEFLE
jgi:hypothetical protein